MQKTSGVPVSGGPLGSSKTRLLFWLFKGDIDVDVDSYFGSLKGARLQGHQKYTVWGMQPSTDAMAPELLEFRLEVPDERGAIAAEKLEEAEAAQDQTQGAQYPLIVEYT